MAVTTESRSDVEDWILKDHPDLIDVVQRYIETPEPPEEAPKRADRCPEYDEGRRSESDWREQTWPYPRQPIEV